MSVSECPKLPEYATRTMSFGEAGFGKNTSELAERERAIAVSVEPAEKGLALRGGCPWC